jgi:2-polyprenyl-3-methyl-5-hydroxy-6-metoxy-1,4-benzoquinol methylase
MAGPDRPEAQVPPTGTLRAGLVPSSGVDGASWTNEAAIARWSATPREFLVLLDPDGGFAKRHLINPTVFRLLGDIDGKRILDAGCGQGYLSRLLAERGTTVVGVEPAKSLFDYAVERELELG